MDLEIKDFTGGLTDEPMTARPNQYAKANNILLNREGNPCSRPGSDLFDVDHAQLPSGNQRVGQLINYNKDTALLAQSATHLYLYDSGWTEVTGPSSTAAFPTVTATARMSYAEWKRHLLICFDSQIPPLVMYVDENGDYQVRTAGLPRLPTPDNFFSSGIQADCISLANDLKTQILAHFADTDQHKAEDTVSEAIITASDATDTPSLLTLTGQLLIAYAKHYSDYIGNGQYHYREGSLITGFSTLSYDSSNFPVADPPDQQLVSIVAPTNLQESAERLNDLRQKFNTHDGNDDVHNAHSGGNQETGSPFIGNTFSGPNAFLDPSYLYGYANTIKSRMNAHFGDGGTSSAPHSTAADSTNTIATSDANSWDSLEELVFNIRIKWHQHELDAQADSGWSYHVNKEDPPEGADNYDVTPTINPSYPSQPFPDTFGGLRSKNVIDIVAMMNKLKNAANAHMLDLTAHYTTNPTSSYVEHQIEFSDVSLATYAYAVVPLYTYQANGIEFQVRGAPVFFEATDVISINNSPLTIHNISSVSNASNTIYDTDNIQIEIYRTIDGGDTYYLVDTIDNGTTSYNDYTTDGLIQSNQTLYTTGGVVEFDTPPSAKYVHVVGDIAYYGNFVDGSTSYSNRIRQAVSGIPWACPGDFYVDLPQDNAGISSHEGIPIAWTATTQYRLEGQIDELGRGSIEAIPLPESVGLVASFSPLQTDQGVIFMGPDGFYITNGYEQKRISRDWLMTYLGLLDNSSTICAALDRNYKRTYWGVNSGGSTDNDTCYVLDLNFPLSENSIFTTLTNDSHFAPTALTFFAGQIIRGDTRGYVFKHDPSYTNDPRIDTSNSASSWSKKTIVYDFITAAFDFGTSKLKKWISQVMVQCRNLGNLSLQINGINDDGKSTQACKPIRSRSSSGLIQEKRHFPAGNLRCFAKQIEFTNADVLIEDSDGSAQATLAQGVGKLAINSGSWPTDTLGNAGTTLDAQTATSGAQFYLQYGSPTCLQQFVASESSDVESIDFAYVTNQYVVGQMRLQIYAVDESGIKTGSALGSSDYVTMPASTSRVFHFPFSTPVSLVAGTQYCIVTSCDETLTAALASFSNNATIQAQRSSSAASSRKLYIFDTSSWVDEDSTCVFSVNAVEGGDFHHFTVGLENDGYVKRYPVITATSTVLYLSDPGTDLPADGTYKWELYGLPKTEKLQLLSFTLPYTAMGQTQESATSEVTGGNA